MFDFPSFDVLGHASVYNIYMRGYICVWIYMCVCVCAFFIGIVCAHECDLMSVCASMIMYTCVFHYAL